jgi:fatty acid-binding protein DegV
MPDMDITIGQIGCVLGTHTGPESLALTYLK